MNHAWHRLHAGIVCLLIALGVMAVSAVGAQAAEEWLIEGASAPNNTPIHAKIHPLKGTLERHIVFLLSNGIEILCGALNTDDGLLIQNTLILILLLFSECHTYRLGVAAPKCDPINQPIDLRLLGHLILHGEPKKLTYILFEPDKTASFGVFEFDEEFCSLIENSELTGSFVMECLNEKLQTKEETGLDNCLQELVHHLIQQAPEKLFPSDVLKLGLLTVLIDGILDLLLSEPNEGRTWSGHV